METETIYTTGLVREISEDVEKTRTIDFVISTSARDRHRTVLNQENWRLDNFNRNPIVGYQHNVYGDGFCEGPNPDDVIGKARAFKEDGKLIGRVTFEPKEVNELAEKIFRKVIFGSLRATSVGFYPFGKGKYGEGDEARGAENETYYFEGQELLEFSIVNIPSNPEALARNAREQSAKVLLNLKRMLNLSISDIERMTVSDVLARMDGKKTTQEEEDVKDEIVQKNFQSRLRELDLFSTK